MPIEGKFDRNVKKFVKTMENFFVFISFPKTIFANSMKEKILEKATDIVFGTLGFQKCYMDVW